MELPFESPLGTRTTSGEHPSASQERHTSDEDGDMAPLGGTGMADRLDAVARFNLCPGAYFIPTVAAANAH